VSVVAGSHVVVANHALLLADAASGSGVLPSFEHLVVDEAHRLQEVATVEEMTGAERLRSRRCVQQRARDALPADELERLLSSHRDSAGEPRAG
jgi:Rad3-related DNA helicase